PPPAAPPSPYTTLFRSPRRGPLPRGGRSGARVRDRPPVLELYERPDPTGVGDDVDGHLGDRAHLQQGEPGGEAGHLVHPARPGTVAGGQAGVGGRGEDDPGDRLVVFDEGTPEPAEVGAEQREPVRDRRV